MFKIINNYRKIAKRQRKKKKRKKENKSQKTLDVSNYIPSDQKLTAQET